MKIISDMKSSSYGLTILAMAVNFWASSHRMHWLLSRQDLIESRREDSLYITEQELIKVNIWFAK
ncbi:5956_t:CDS:2, partial [Acaulospora morrowiae]